MTVLCHGGCEHYTNNRMCLTYPPCLTIALHEFFRLSWEGNNLLSNLNPYLTYLLCFVFVNRKHIFMDDGWTDSPSRELLPPKSPESMLLERGTKGLSNHCLIYTPLDSKVNSCEGFLWEFQGQWFERWVFHLLHLQRGISLRVFSGDSAEGH